LTSVPNFPPEQDAPGPPEEIKVTIVDNRTAAELGDLKKAQTTQREVPARNGTANAAAAAPAAGPGRDP
jgi:hypothetical protein